VLHGDDAAAPSPLAPVLLRRARFCRHLLNNHHHLLHATQTINGGAVGESAPVVLVVAVAGS
jgi:hypothetical protein